MSGTLIYRFLLLILGFGLPFSSMAAPQKCEDLLRRARAQGVREEIYQRLNPVGIDSGVSHFLRSIDDLNRMTHPIAVELQKEVFASEFSMVYSLMTEVVAVDRTLRFPTYGLAYKYLDVLLMALDEIKPSHPSYQFVRDLTNLKLEFLKASLERPKDGRLN